MNDYINFNRIAKFLLEQSQNAYDKNDYKKANAIHAKLERLHRAWDEQTMRLYTDPMFIVNCEMEQSK